MPKSAPPASPFDVNTPRLFSIDHGRPFLRDLAEELIGALGEELPRAQIYFPTRRAVRAAGEAFLDAYKRRGVGAALLPRFDAIGDIDEEEHTVFAGGPEDELALPPAITAIERMVRLARLVAARDRAFQGHENWPAAISAARELGKLIDALYTEEVDPKRLRTLDVADIAGHWTNSLQFLDIVISAWPSYLAEIGRTDPADRRAKLISATAQRIRIAPPDHPLIIAGTTASAPAVARLVDAISRAPKGLVVLPGLDREMDARAFAAIDDEDAHPQSGLKALLLALKTAPQDVRPWRGSGAAGPRGELLAMALRPAAATDDWLRLVAGLTARDKGLARSTRGLSIVEADNEETEASIIAAQFRLIAENPDKTAILVTPDRGLSRRVALKMRRWNILVDDSAGVPFAHTSRGVFLRLVAEFLDAPEDPVLILALLRHPLATFGEEAGISDAADTIDRKLRFDRLPAGLEAFLRTFDDGRHEGERRIIQTLLEAQSLYRNRRDGSFEGLLDAHIRAAEMIAGEENLWSGDDGDAGATLFAEIRSAAGGVDEIAGRRYPEVFDALVAGVAVRKRTPSHPRLSILGPLEARMQVADLIILGGLNEGAWPADAARDPFLSRAMRKRLGLLSPERRIGLSAHDFASLASHENILLTRARRSGGKPSNPSRWIIRLKNLLEAAGALATVDQSEVQRGVVERLDRAERYAPQAPPRPKAGPGRRPQAASVTRVAKWLRDPYSAYAAYLLGLRKLDDPGGVFGAREMGSLMHKVYERAARTAAAPTRATLQEIFDEEAQAFGLGAADRRFWSVAVDDVFEWFMAFEGERRAEGKATVLEGEGRWTLPGIDPPFTLTARADRIDILKDGRAAIIDYKLGRPPSEKQLRYFSPQLSLTGAIVEAGGFSDIGERPVAYYAYHRLLNRERGAVDPSLAISEGDASAAIRDAADRLKAWVRKFDDPGMVYLSQPRPEFTDDFGDYDQLARRREWGATDDDGDGGGE
jgi:ATP-dependent helicase/nuclease subunit B